MEDAPITVEMRVLQRAAELLGSERALARRLQVPASTLFGWVHGTERPPRGIFLDAVDVVVELGAGTPPDAAPLPGTREPAR
jgi:hypothetical protein